MIRGGGGSFVHARSGRREDVDRLGDRLPHRAGTCRAGRLRLLILGLAAAIVAGCLWGEPVERRYYTLMQPVPSRTAENRFADDLWVREVQMASVYDRTQIVFRQSPTELRYFPRESWADRPQRMLGQHIVQTMRASGLFQSVSARLGTSPPGYVLDTNVHAIEQLDGGDIWYAHLAMTFRLTRFGENDVLWEHSFSERRPLNHKDVSLTVRALSEILDEQMSLVLTQMEAKLSGEPPERGDEEDARAMASAPPELEEPTHEREESVTVDHAKTSHVETVQRPTLLGDRAERTWAWGGERIDWRRSSQYTSDPTVVPPGKGAVFLPALGGHPDREPGVEIHGDGGVVTSGLMGQRIVVEPGEYEVHFGSGTFAQRMTRSVAVDEGEVMIVEPDWGTLEVSVVDERFIAWRGSYEINDQTRSEYVGLGYGADEEQGERTQVWVLRPGIYRIVQPGASYRTRTNFTTVQLPPGDHIPFVLVMDPTGGDFLGAGISDQEEDGLISADDRWSIRSSAGGDFLWNSRSGYDTEVGTELALSFFLDNLIRFRLEPHLWTTRLEIEESHRLLGRVSPDGSRESIFSGELEPVTDRMYVNTLYIYELLSWAGPYARVGGETSLFHRYRAPGAEQEVLIFDEDGQEMESHPAGTKDRVRLARSFSPLEFKEGAGVNFRVLRTANVDLDLRLGFGGRQYLSLGQLLANEERSTENELVLERTSNSFLVGPETTIVGSARLTRYIQATTELDALLPLGDRYSTRYTWRNSVSLRLSTFASLIYTLNLDQNPNVGRENPLHLDQRLGLRFSFALF